MNRANKTAIVVAVLLVIAALPFPTSSAQAQRPDSCLGGTLTPPTPAGSDLVVKVDCTVGAGTYKFGNVNILAGGILRFADATIDFWAANILVENGGSLIAGSPTAPIGTQDLGNVVTIHLYGPDQTGQNPNKPGTGVTCLSDPARCGVPQKIWDSNVDPNTHQPIPPAQATKIQTILDGDQSLTYAGSVTYDYFYAYHPLLYDDANPQGYFGYKVLAVSYGGTLQLFGKKGATYSATGECGEPAPSTSGTSWARLNGTPTTNPTTLTLDRKVSLKKGDQIVVTTTDYLPGHSERLTVSADVACGTTITVDETLQYAHNGTRYSLSAVPDRVGLDPALKNAGAETRAAVGLLSRNIRIVSAGDTLNDDFPAESTGYFFGGHMIVRQGFKLVQIQGVEFYQMGQGGTAGALPRPLPPRSEDAESADGSGWDHALTASVPDLRDGLLRLGFDDALDRAARDPGRHPRAQRRIQVHRPRLLPGGRDGDQQHARGQPGDLRPRRRQATSRTRARCRASWPRPICTPPP